MKIRQFTGLMNQTPDGNRVCKCEKVLHQSSYEKTRITMNKSENINMADHTITRKNMMGLDLIEQFVVLSLYLWYISRLWPGKVEELNLYLSMLILSEGIVVFILIIRRTTKTISHSFRDWFIAFSATLLPLLVNNGGAPFMPRIGVILIFWGLVIHVWAKLNLLRSFGIVPANRGIKVKGLYSLVRHPMYAGYFFTHVGFIIAAPSAWNFCIYICAWGFMLSRIFVEESLLLRSPEYRTYTVRVPYRLIPGVF